VTFVDCACIAEMLQRHWRVFVTVQKDKFSAAAWIC